MKELITKHISTVVEHNVDFSKFPFLKADTVQHICNLFYEYDETVSDYLLLRSHTYHERVEVNILNCKYGDYSRDLNLWAYNEDELFIYTYCEGDTTLSIYKDKESYQKAYDKAYKFYKEEW